MALLLAADVTDVGILLELMAQRIEPVEIMEPAASESLDRIVYRLGRVLPRDRFNRIMYRLMKQALKK